MSLTVREQSKHNWTIGARGTAGRVWRVFGTTDIAAAAAQILASADVEWNGLFRDDANINITEIGFGAWECKVPYQVFDLSGGTTTPTILSFKTSGGTEKITQTSGTITPYTGIPGTGAASNDFGGGINWDGKKFSGVEVYSPVFDFEIETYMPQNAVTTAYVATLLALTAKTNNAAWKGFNAGEVLYLGVQGCQDKGGKYKLNHGFKGSPNRTGVSLAGGAITGVTKKGWDYVWVYYVPDKDDDGKSIIKARSAYVHQVYDSGNFNLIGV